jgi:hypothetical protein
MKEKRRRREGWRAGRGKFANFTANGTGKIDAILVQVQRTQPEISFACVFVYVCMREREVFDQNHMLAGRKRGPHRAVTQNNGERQSKCT